VGVGSVSVDLTGLDVIERRLVEDVRRWLEREQNALEAALESASAPLRRLTDRAMASEAVRDRIDRATNEVVARLSSATQDRFAAVEPLRLHRDLTARRAALRRTEQAADGLTTRYVGMMTAEGVAAGAASMTPATAVVSFLPDLVAALALSIHGASHLAVLYGVTTPGPAAVATGIQLASVAPDTDVARRRELFVELVRRLEAPATSRPSSERVSRLVAQQAAVRALRETIEQTVRRVARRRLAMFVPVLGIAAHGAASGWLAGQVCAASRHLGRTVYLARSGPHGTDELLGT
jgi:hypothetical protein